MTRPLWWRRGDRAPLFICIVILVSGLIGTPSATAGSCPAKPPIRPEIDAPATVFIPCTTQPPVIDGLGDEAAWKDAAVITDFRQVQPVEGAAPSARTEVRILYDSDAIYFLLRAYQAREDIVASLQARDTDLGPDDRFVIILDTFGNKRDAFAFIVNPNGAKRDVLFENNNTDYPNWNAIWYAKANIDDEGWTAEVAIPIKSLAFSKKPHDWGFNISRHIQHNNEEVRWTSIRQDLDNVNVSQIGVMRGLEGLDQGLGLDVKVAGALSHIDDKPRDKSGFSFDPSVDLFYRVTPSVTASLTYNTDFAEAAVDERKVNLSRFSLFFPETRAFFLQDVGIFEFADLDGDYINGRPFFTRRIGLTSRGIVDILGGGKLTGREGGVNFGLMSVQTKSSDEFSLDSQNLSVARVAVNVLDESSLGAIVTHGSPLGGPQNTVYGFDFRFQDNTFRGQSRALKSTWWFLRTDTEGVSGGEDGFGASLEYPNDRINWHLRAMQLEHNYNPTLGFANRVDIREYRADYRYRWRPTESIFRTIDVQAKSIVTTDLDNELESLETDAILDIHTNPDDHPTAKLRFFRERLDNGFTLPKGLFIPAGDYNYLRPRLEMGFARQRPLSGKFTVECCDYYTGTNFQFNAHIDYRPSEYLSFTLRYDHNALSLPTGHAVIRIASIEADWNMTPDLQWSNIVQYDNVSDDVGLNSRLRWIITPGSEFFIVINEDALAPDWDLRHQRNEAIIKLGHTFRM